MQVVIIRSNPTLLEAECGLCGASYDTSAREDPIEAMVAHVIIKHKDSLKEAEVKRLIEFIARKPINISDLD